MFPLHLIHEIKIRLIKMMHPYVPVLATAGVSSTLRINGNGIQRSKVALDTPNLVLKNLVVKARFELALARRCGGHVGSSLASAENNEFFFGRDGGSVEGRVGEVGLENFEVAGGDDLTW